MKFPGFRQWHGVCHSWLRLLSAILLAMFVAGCQTETPPDQAPPSPELPTPVPVPTESLETWEACFLRNSAALPAGAKLGTGSEAAYLGLARIGYVQTIVEPIEEAGEKCLRTTSRSVSSFQRLGQTVRQEVVVTSVERLSGEMIRLESTMSGGDAPVVTKAKFGENSVALVTETAGKKSEQSLPWSPDYRGPFGVEQSLQAEPLKTGKTREISLFLPVLNIVGQARLEAVGRERVELPGGQQELIRITSSTKIGPQSLDMLMWQNDEGKVLKTEVVGIGQVNFRAPREEALRDAEQAELDLMITSTVKLKSPAKIPLNASKAVYLAKLRGGIGSTKFETGLSQQVEKLADDQLRITVSRVTPTTPLPEDSATKIEFPTDDDSSSNSLIQSDDPAVVALAQGVAAGETEPAKIAIALEQQVHSTITKKNFSQAFASAAEVAVSKQGDCTEHAVLLAAMCRARGIPARVAFGLVYYPPEQGFLYHMWNEVWTGDRWVPLDATLGQGIAPIDRLKLASSSLAGASPYAAMLPVVQVFGRLELEVIEVE